MLLVNSAIYYIASTSENSKLSSYICKEVTLLY